ncbi:hypothetical protein EJ08DRAFT_664280 [Tothia fuscella]|uniref:Uncharacterized protein n=1 Tax=Tothia fuscella TaxID=1048955 RepID=A0A9P4NIV6_9PEZI|nr:hypothetical protein EJ08DRAFT_664280 [Tothia fuscella]
MHAKPISLYSFAGAERILTSPLHIHAWNEKYRVPKLSEFTSYLHNLPVLPWNLQPNPKRMHILSRPQNKFNTTQIGTEYKYGMRVRTKVNEREYIQFFVGKMEYPPKRVGGWVTVMSAAHKYGQGRIGKWIEVEEKDYPVREGKSYGWDMKCDGCGHGHWIECSALSEEVEKKGEGKVEMNGNGNGARDLDDEDED